MKITIGKIFLITGLITIFFFIFSEEVNAGCYFVTSWQTGCMGGAVCPSGAFGCGYGEYETNSCITCRNGWTIWECCDLCSQCRGGGAADTEPPVCRSVEPRDYTSFSTILSGQYGPTVWQGQDRSPGFEPDGYLAPWGGNGAVSTRGGAYNDILPHSGSYLLRLNNEQELATLTIPVTPKHVYRVKIWGTSKRTGSPSNPNKSRGWITVTSGGIGVGPTEVGYSQSFNWYNWNESAPLIIWARDSSLTITLTQTTVEGDGVPVQFDDLTVEEMPTSECSTQDCLLELYATDNKRVAQMRFSNDKTNWTDWEEFYPVKIPYTLGANGQVWAQFKDGAGNESEISDSCSGTCMVNQPPTCDSFSVPTPIHQGEIVDIDVTGSDPEGNLDRIEVYFSPTAFQSWTQINGARSCSGATCSVSIPWDTSSVLVGSYYVVANVYDKDGSKCSGNPWIPFPPGWSICAPDTCRRIVIIEEPLPGPWFQTQEGDVHAQGSISSEIPPPKAAITNYFNLKGDGGTPGVVSHKDPLGPNPWGDGEVSETGWLANTKFSRKYYDYFYQLLGSPTEENFTGTLPTGDGIYYAGSNQTLSGSWRLPANRKIVVLVKGDVKIPSNIGVPQGSFLAIIAKGRIIVTNSVSQIEGVFITDETFYSYSGGGASVALTGEGVFIAEGFDLGRDLGVGNATTPAEKFIYRPDFWFSAPDELLIPSYTWQELAP